MDTHGSDVITDGSLNHCDASKCHCIRTLPSVPAVVDTGTPLFPSGHNLSKGSKWSGTCREPESIIATISLPSCFTRKRIKGVNFIVSLAHIVPTVAPYTPVVISHTCSVVPFRVLASRCGKGTELLPLQLIMNSSASRFSIGQLRSTGTHLCAFTTSFVDSGTFQAMAELPCFPKPFFSPPSLLSHVNLI